MEQVGRVLPHPSPEQVRLITLPFPPTCPTGESGGGMGKGLTPSLASQLSVMLIHSRLSVVKRCL